MTELAEYLMINYYNKYNGSRSDVIPDIDTLECGLKNHSDKIVIIRDEKIKGVAIYLTLSDETYDLMSNLDITRLDILTRLLKEEGRNVHFVLLAAKGINTILLGIKEIKRRLNPRTISWWDPELKRLHKYNLEKGV
jgi:hypothetical protein